jgi:hypothetical protein
MTSCYRRPARHKAGRGRASENDGDMLADTRHILTGVHAEVPSSRSADWTANCELSPLLTGCDTTADA